MSIINLALDKYSEKKARTEKFTDSELISKEFDQQLETAPSLLRPPTDSVYSEEGSYGAMLRSYARKSSQIHQGGVESSEGLTEGGILEERGMEGSRREGGFSMALSMDYEIVTPDGDLVESTGAKNVSGVCGVCIVSVWCVHCQ